jgi:hypothetical protein
MQKEKRNYFAALGFLFNFAAELTHNYTHAPLQADKSITTTKRNRQNEKDKRHGLPYPRHISYGIMRQCV